MGSKIGVVPPSTEGSTVYTLFTGISKDQNEQTLTQSLWESALTTPATLTRVTQSHSSGFWEGWVCDEGGFDHLLTWVEPQDLPMDRVQWIRTSFESLRHASPSGTVTMLTDTAVSDSSLLTVLCGINGKKMRRRGFVSRLNVGAPLCGYHMVGIYSLVILELIARWEK